MSDEMACRTVQYQANQRRILSTTLPSSFCELPVKELLYMDLLKIANA